MIILKLTLLLKGKKKKKNRPVELLLLSHTVVKTRTSITSIILF
jgi:hypothetical protein